MLLSIKYVSTWTQTPINLMVEHGVISPDSVGRQDYTGRARRCFIYRTEGLTQSPQGNDVLLPFR